LFDLVCHTLYVALDADLSSTLATRPAGLE